MPEARFLRGQDPKETMKIGIANVIFSKTTKGKDNAYSYGLYYDAEEWMRVIQWLLKKKYTPFDVENILRSKLMRWASDQAPDYREVPEIDEPQNTLEDFTHYIKQPNNFRPRFKSAIDDFLQNEIYSKPEEEEYWRETLGYDKKGNPLNEDMGGVGAPMATLGNTPGMGNAVPASQTTLGSGDKWGGLGAKPKKKRKGKKTKLVKESLNEENINPYDKLGMSMAKKMGVKPPFKKKKAKGNQNSMTQTVK
jgi:hypothetical protein